MLKRGQEPLRMYYEAFSPPALKHQALAPRQEGIRATPRCLQDKRERGEKGRKERGKNYDSKVHQPSPTMTHTRLHTHETCSTTAAMHWRADSPAEHMPPKKSTRPGVELAKRCVTAAPRRETTRAKRSEASEQVKGRFGEHGVGSAFDLFRWLICVGGRTGVRIECFVGLGVGEWFCQKGVYPHHYSISVRWDLEHVPERTSVLSVSRRTFDAQFKI